MRSLSILMALAVWQQAAYAAAPATAAAAPSKTAPTDNVAPANGEDATDYEPSRAPLNAQPETPPENAATRSRWIAPEATEAKVLNEKAKTTAPAKVRIGLRLTPFNKIVTKARDGQVSTRYIPGEALRHTLRARLNKMNHFFVGEWHLETVPLKWVQKTRRYEVRLNVYRRYGAFGQLEESVGSVDLAGVLDEQKDNVHVLLGVARQRLRDKEGNPYLDVVAGFAPGSAPAPTGPELSKNDRGTRAPPAAAPANFDGELIRGRF
jgi:hypothetical protein